MRVSRHGGGGGRTELTSEEAKREERGLGSGERVRGLAWHQAEQEVSPLGQWSGSWSASFFCPSALGPLKEMRLSQPALSSLDRNNL